MCKIVEIDIMMFFFFVFRTKSIIFFNRVQKGQIDISLIIGRTNLNSNTHHFFDCSHHSIFHYILNRKNQNQTPSEITQLSMNLCENCVNFVLIITNE